MLEIVKEEVSMEEDLKNKIIMLCKFYNLKPIFKNGGFKKIKKTNLVYIEPNEIIISGIRFFIFNGGNEIYIDNLKNKISFKSFDIILKAIP